MADLLFTHIIKCNSCFLWLPVLSRRTLLLFFKSLAVTSTASSEWQPNTMTWWPNKRRLPATVLSEYGKLPADTDVLCTFPLFCHQTIWNLQDQAGSTQWYNVRRPGHACIHCKQNVPGPDKATTRKKSRTKNNSSQVLEMRGGSAWKQQQGL